MATASSLGSCGVMTVGVVPTILLSKPPFRGLSIYSNFLYRWCEMSVSTRFLSKHL